MRVEATRDMGNFVDSAFLVAYQDPSKMVSVDFGVNCFSRAERTPRAVIYGDNGLALGLYVGDSVDAKEMDKVRKLLPSTMKAFRDEAIRKGLLNDGICLRRGGSKFYIRTLKIDEVSISE